MNFTMDTLRNIEQKLIELDLKLDELKKFDWKSLFVGTIVNLIMSLGIPPESAGAVWEIIKRAFNELKV